MVEALAVIFGSDISPARTWRTSKWAANYGGPILRSLAIWIVPRRLDRLLVQPRLSDLLVQPVRLSPLGPGGQVVQLARLLRRTLRPGGTLGTCIAFRTGWTGWSFKAASERQEGYERNGCHDTHIGDLRRWSA